MEKMYTLRQTSELLGVTVRTLRDWIVKGRLHAVKHEQGKKWVVAETEIIRIKNLMK